MTARVAPLRPARAPEVLGRALRLCCVHCGRTPLFAGWFRMHEECAACGYRYEREPGYFVGAIYVNYAVTAAAAIGTVLALDHLIGLSLTMQIVLAVTLCALVPLAFFRYSRSLWLSVDYLVTRADQKNAPPSRPA